MKLIDKKIAQAELIEKKYLLADCIARKITPNDGK
jgi:hypothetical protein